MTGVSECSQQRGNLKDDGYNTLVFTKTYIFRMGICLNYPD
ncbi:MULTISPECIES: hypothetical protein [Photorhabdus]|nr:MULTISPECIES: hypothetical protein [Photorhabdus]MDB6366335.1 hypothetical protein [Photorhabdus bodei]